jgi:glycosyltransferase involved in cell wall biosynthesis
MSAAQKSLHIAILIGRFPPGALGGAEHQAECWATRLSDVHRVTVVTRQEPPAPAGTEVRDGFSIIRNPLSRVPVWRGLRDLAAIEQAVARLFPRPDVLLCFQTFISGFAGVRIQRNLGIPAIVWIRGEGEYRMDHAARARWVGPRVWSDARGVLVQSEGNRDALLREIERFAPARRAGVAAHLEVVGNGIDLPVIDGRTAEAGTRFLSVGRLIREKGMDVVIEAAAMLRRPLTIAGTGPERAALETLARERGADVRFEGFVDRARLAELHRESTAVVLAARHGEGLPNAVLEAMAQARPVVATRVMGARDLIVDGVNGLLVAPGDAGQLREALDRVARDPALAAKLGAAARRSASEYAWERVRPKLEAALERWAT